MLSRSLTLAVAFALAAGLLFVPAANAAGRPPCLVSNERTNLGISDLQASIDAAVPGDTLVIKGTCVGIVGPLQQANFIINKDLTLKGVSNKPFGQATLDGGGAGPVVWVRDGANVTFTGLTITNANAHPNNMSFGGLQNDHSVVTLIDSAVTGNYARTAAGIGNYLGTMTLTNSTVSGNVADFGGGGIYNMGTLYLMNSMVSGNTGGGGGGIFNFRVDTIPVSGLLTVTNSAITGNTATQGGGIYNQGSQYGLGVLNLTDSRVTDNTANVGAGIYNVGTAVITESSVSDNVTALLGGVGGYGGGIANVRGYLSEPAVLSLTNSTVSGNSAAGMGGGIVNGLGHLDGSVAVLSGTTVSRNTTPYSGGGIANRGTLIIEGSSVSTNVANFGGGIFGDGTLTFSSTPTTVGGNTGTLMVGGIMNGGGTVTGGCPSVLGQAVPPSTTEVGLVVYDPPNISGWEFFKDYNGFSC